MTIFTFILLGMGLIAGGILIWGIAVFNQLITLKNRFENAFSQIDVQLKRRHDLIPNLVETAQGYMDHESETLQKVTEARNRAIQAEQKAVDEPGDPNAMSELMDAEGSLSGALGGLRVSVEDYPELKANETMQQLMEQLTSTENRIAFARQAFNDAVMRYNTKREKFPNNILSSAFGFKEAELFEIEDSKERKNPDVAFGSSVEEPSVQE